MSRQTFGAWADIFRSKRIDLSCDLHNITADEIKAITGLEPRTMAKMDSSQDLPPVFKDNGYFLLPVKNGLYAIVRGNGFHKLENTVHPVAHTSRIQFPLATAGRGMGEMQYLDYSTHSGALESVVKKEALYPSIRGREYSKSFNFFVSKTKIDVSAVQLEVDSGLEGKDAIVLVEAKINTPDDFIIRQLFYPFRHFRVIAPHKEIIPVFFTYEPKNKHYNYWIYEFSDPDNYNSIRLKETKTLTITAREEITIEKIDAAKESPLQSGLIPQANDLNKVIELVFKVAEGIDNYKDIAEHFGFDERQSSYYREAAEALGLVTSERGHYVLTAQGKHFSVLSTDKRNIFIAHILAGFTLVHDSMRILSEKQRLTNSDLLNIIRQNSSLSGTTVNRRAQSLRAWLKWIADSTGAFSYNKDEFLS